MRWHRHEPGPETVDAACRALGTADGRLCFAGGNVDDDSDVLGARLWQVAADGRWRQVADPHGLLDAEPGVYAIDAIAVRGDATVVAVGSFDDGRGGGGCVWAGVPDATAPGGMTWRRRRLDAGGALSAVALAADGRGAFAVGDGGDGFACWQADDAADLATWRRVAPPEGTTLAAPGGSDGVAFAVTAHPQLGWIAVGGEVVVGARVGAVWTSPDAETWTRLAYDPATFGGRGRNVVRDAAVDPDGAVLAVGQGPDGAAIWWSPDGTSWLRGPDDAVFGTESDAEATSVVWRNAMWFVGGYLGEEAVVWTAAATGPDGGIPTDWVCGVIAGDSAADLDEGAAIFALHLGDDGELLAVGRDGDAAFVASLASGTSVAGTSADGWRRCDIQDADGEVAGTTEPAGLWCAATGPTPDGGRATVVAGDCGDGAGVWNRSEGVAFVAVPDPGEVFAAPSEVVVVGVAEVGTDAAVVVGDRGEAPVAWTVVDAEVTARVGLPLPDDAADGEVGAAIRGVAVGAAADTAVVWTASSDAGTASGAGWRVAVLPSPPGHSGDDRSAAEAVAVDGPGMDVLCVGGHAGAAPVVWSVGTSPDSAPATAAVLPDARNGFGRVHAVAVRPDGVAVAAGRSGTAAGFWYRPGVGAAWCSVGFDKVRFGGADLVTADAAAVTTDGMFVVAGASEHAGRRRLRIWTSPDGERWTLTPDAALGAGRRDSGWPFADAVAVTADGGVIVAGSDTDTAGATVVAVWIGTPDT